METAYTYDGSLGGLLCCVFDSYTRREMPLAILTEGEPTFYRTWPVETVEAHAMRVWRSLGRLSGEIQEWVKRGWLSCVQDREWMIYQFIRLAYQYGARVTSMLTNATVCQLFKAVRMVGNEAGQLIEFLRFSDCGEGLVAVIEPKCIVLPLMQQHFTDRYPEEIFLIHDKTNHMALFYRPYQAQILPVERLEVPAMGAEEQMFRALWRKYYEVAAVEGRENPRCRMGHMPKRFWNHMTEFSQTPAGEPEPGTDRLTQGPSPSILPG